MINRIERSAGDVDTSQLLYCMDKANERLSVYKIRSGVVSEAMTYYLQLSNNGLFLVCKPLVPGQQMKDSLRIAFLDKTQTLRINNNDNYTLFPDYYKLVKRQVESRGQITALLFLLSDAIGDYPISNVLPLLEFYPQSNKRIRQAKVVTQRSQADVQDTWVCQYYYNKSNKLDSVNASSSEETRFTKKIHYNGAKISSIDSYLNIESRQTVDRSISYNRTNRYLIKSQERFYETGKNRETISTVTSTQHYSGMLRNMEPSIKEVLELLKRKKPYDKKRKPVQDLLLGSHGRGC
ncbi:hypothetical protein ACXZ1K_13420 [Pedobacter sp. PWIIR3]